MLGNIIYSNRSLRQIFNKLNYCNMTVYVCERETGNRDTNHSTKGFVVYNNRNFA